MKSTLRVLPLVIVAIAFVLGQVQSANRQNNTERAVRANCEVVSVLLANRADRDKTIKLFAPIRRQNPKQFDALVKRAEEGDRRLEAVRGDLACKPQP